MKPRLLYVINSFIPAGAELGLLTLVQCGFFEAFDLHIVALVSGEERGPVHRPLLERLGAERVSYLRKAPRIPDWALPSLAFGIARKLRDVKPDIALLSLPQAVLCGRFASLFYPRVKLAVFNHTVDCERRLAKMALDLTAGKTDLLLGDTPATLNAWMPAYVHKPPAAEVPLAVCEAFSSRPWRRPETFRLLNLGRLVPQKNQRSLLQAFADLVRAGYSAELDIAGQGPLQADLENLVAQLGIQKHVRFLGFVQNPWELLAQAHIYIQPSLHEGLAISVVQAMAAGLIVIASDVGGIRDYGVDRVNMIKLSPPAPPESIVQALTYALDEYAALEPMADAARRTACARFGEESVKKKWAFAQSALRQLVIAASGA